MLDITEGLGKNSPTQDKFDYTQRETAPKTGDIPLLLNKINLNANFISPSDACGWSGRYSH